MAAFSAGLAGLGAGLKDLQQVSQVTFADMKNAAQGTIMGMGVGWEGDNDSDSDGGRRGRKRLNDSGSEASISETELRDAKLADLDPDVDFDHNVSGRPLPRACAAAVGAHPQPRSAVCCLNAYVDSFYGTMDAVPGCVRCAVMPGCKVSQHVNKLHENCVQTNRAKAREGKNRGLRELGDLIAQLRLRAHERQWMLTRFIVAMMDQSREYKLNERWFRMVGLVKLISGVLVPVFISFLSNTNNSESTTIVLVNCSIIFSGEPETAAVRARHSPLWVHRHAITGSNLPPYCFADKQQRINAVIRPSAVIGTVATALEDFFRFGMRATARKIAHTRIMRTFWEYHGLSGTFKHYKYHTGECRPFRPPARTQ